MSANAAWRKYITAARMSGLDPGVILGIDIYIPTRSNRIRSVAGRGELQDLYTLHGALYSED